MTPIEIWVLSGKALILFIMRNKNIFIPLIIILVFGALISKSQFSFKDLQNTPREELIEHIQDDSTRTWVRFIYHENQKQTNDLKLINRGIFVPPDK